MSGGHTDLARKEKEENLNCDAPPATAAIKTSKESVYFYNGIDRRDNSVGYTKDNCVPACTDCNFLKSRLGGEDFMAMVVRIYNHVKTHQNVELLAQRPKPDTYNWKLSRKKKTDLASFKILNAPPDYSKRLKACHHPLQGPFLKVLCVCKDNTSISPTVALVVSNGKYNCNAVSCGIGKDSIIVIDPVLVEWADVIVVADEEHLPVVEQLVSKCSNPNKKVYCLNIPDNYAAFSRTLVDIIRDRLNAHGFVGTKDELLVGEFDLTGTQ
jgi:predicted protein tyrosine phosphatase